MESFQCSLNPFQHLIPLTLHPFWVPSPAVFHKATASLLMFIILYLWTPLSPPAPKDGWCPLPSMPWLQPPQLSVCRRLLSPRHRPGSFLDLGAVFPAACFAPSSDCPSNFNKLNMDLFPLPHGHPPSRFQLVHFPPTALFISYKVLSLWPVEFLPDSPWPHDCGHHRVQV